MNPSRLEEIFERALAVPAAQRAAWLQSYCGEEATLRFNVESLLRAHEQARGFMESAPVDLTAGLPAHAPSSEEKPGTRIGRYKLLEKIGEGGCGLVFMAEQQEPIHRRVAVKVIKLGMDTKEVIARFEAERQAVALMDHPNIARVLDAGATDAGRPYFVMELVRGVKLTDYCDQNNLTPTARLGLFTQVCNAVQHAHQKGVIHRDLKPSNILVTLHDGVPVPKVIDFGIAKATQGRLTDATLFTAFQQFIGTPAYMSPEQAEMSGLDVDTRSDIYSLGVLLYELLTGRPPFDPKSLVRSGLDEIRRIIREVDPPRPSTRLGTMADADLATVAKQRGLAPTHLSTLLRGDLDWIVMRCLEKDRTRRYETANALALDVQRHLKDEPIVARPPGAAYRFQKLVRRNRLAFAAGMVVIVALVIAVTLSTASLQAGAKRARAGQLAEQLARERAEAAEAAAKGSAAAARDSEQLAITARMNAERLLTFVFTDLGDQLNDFGQVALLRQTTEKTVAYYESLPPALQTRETRANHAFALAGVGSVRWIGTFTSGHADYGHPTARARLNRAREIFDELQATGPLTPFMSLAAGVVWWAEAQQNMGEDRPADSIRALDRAEALLQGALNDSEWGSWAHCQQTAIVFGKAALLVRRKRVTEALPEFQRALSLAALAERGKPASRHPGFLALQIKVYLTPALFAAGRRKEASDLATRTRDDLRELLKREPSFIPIRWALAMANINIAQYTRPQWRFAEALEAVGEARLHLGEMLRLDPTNWGAQGYIAYLWAGSSSSGQFSYEWLRGDFAAAEASIRRGIELWTVDFAPPDSRRALLGAYFSLARVFAATGRDEEADRQIAEARALQKRIAEERPWLTPLEREVDWATHEEAFREIEYQRLNWPAISERAEQALQKFRTWNNEDPSTTALRAVTHRDRMRAAFEMGDYATAGQQLALWRPPITVVPATADIQQRFDRVGILLTRVHVLARSGARQVARSALDELWPEVEAVFAVEPTHVFNRVQFARALLIKSEVGEVTASSKREMLERAARLLRPAADTLTRYEREILLAEIERQLAAATNTAD